jgi:hypothetical protein
MAQVMTLLGYGIGRLVESMPGPVVTLSKLPVEPKRWDLVEVGLGLLDMDGNEEAVTVDPGKKQQPARKKSRRKKRRKFDRET